MKLWRIFGKLSQNLRKTWNIYQNPFRWEQKVITIRISQFFGKFSVNLQRTFGNSCLISTQQLSSHTSQRLFFETQRFNNYRIWGPVRLFDVALGLFHIDLSSWLLQYGKGCGNTFLHWPTTQLKATSHLTILMRETGKIRRNNYWDGQCDPFLLGKTWSVSLIAHAGQRHRKSLSEKQPL